MKERMKMIFIGHKYSHLNEGVFTVGKEYKTIFTDDEDETQLFIDDEGDKMWAFKECFEEVK